MQLFKPYESQAKNPDKRKGTASTKDAAKAKEPSTPKDKVARVTTPATDAPNSAATTPKAPVKKQIATPRRRQAEQARRDRIQPVLTRKESRLREREARFKARDDAMAKTHARPYNHLIRNWVDRRWNLAEFALPAMVVLFIGFIGGAYIWPTLMLVTPYVIWGVFALLVIDTFLMWVGLRKRLRQFFPNEPLKGKLSYAASRAMLMRRSRIPAPEVKRGARFIWPPEKSA